MRRFKSFSTGLFTGAVIGAVIGMIADPITEGQRKRMRKSSVRALKKIGNAIENISEIGR